MIYDTIYICVFSETLHNKIESVYDSELIDYC